MVSCELEFRGINSKHLKMYLEELGGNPITDKPPHLYEGKNWSGEVLSEGELVLTPVFKVNTVLIRFSATDEKILKEIVKKYRLKTTRIGG
ncbi:hypothetical protein [Robertmurraya andreesenii]|uniref:Molybdopterin cofactor biosynthesis MoaD-related C-terminal domain-containing protein n=1 Tax=Anoxybacillus andreesenii TaxID=1325932 RepID=A0ABT9V4E1_9BACL|nr:hypothetical protein [Robertmurraya andreesenii]MDQ0155730.1 hypothetical protein [Robertmurraya andreesenii]